MCTGSKDRSFFILSKHLINIYLQTNLLKLVGDILIGQSGYKKPKKYFMHDLKACSFYFITYFNLFGTIRREVMSF
jgi:hypothetical protein